MTLRHQKINSVCLPADGIGFRDMNGFKIRDGEFVTARCAVIPSDGSADFKRGFLRQGLRSCEGGFRCGFNNTLADAGAVADLQKADLSATALSVKPALKADGPIFMVRQIPNG